MSNETPKFKSDFDKQVGIGIAVLILVSLAFGVFTSFYTVEPDEKAVVIRVGKYIKTNPPGLHFKIPFNIDKVHKVRTESILQEEFGFRSSGYDSSRTQYKKGKYSEESKMLTGDLNVADVEWVVQYKISDPYKFLFKSNSPKRNIRDISMSIMRRVVGDIPVGTVLTTGRAEIASQAKVHMQEVLDHYDVGIRIITVKLQDVNPPEGVKSSFNEVNEAKQEQEKDINQAERAYNKVIPEARGKAEKLISQAKGHSIAVINRAEGDVSKFKALLMEYKRAPKITRERIYIETMESLFKSFKNLIIVDPKVKGVLPLYGQTNLVKE